MADLPVLRIAPSILAADFAQLGDEIRAVEAAGADWIHIDVMDGHFVPNLTIGPAVVKALRPHTSLPFDVHLMISPADPLVEAFADAGADTISVHPEAGPHLHRTLQTIRGLGKRAGVVLNPATPVDAIDFLASQLDKIKTLRQRIDQHTAAGGAPIDLEVDGGIDTSTAPLAAGAGADVLVAGTATFRGGPSAYANNISALRSAAESGR
jgi:ribulose-phosphate 3-epimerase